LPTAASFGQSGRAPDADLAVNGKQASAGKHGANRKICRIDNEKMNESPKQAGRKATGSNAPGFLDAYIIRGRKTPWRMPG
jgi:hypothetical protein